MVFRQWNNFSPNLPIVKINDESYLIHIMTFLKICQKQMFQSFFPFAFSAKMWSKETLIKGMEYGYNVSVSKLTSMPSFPGGPGGPGVPSVPRGPGLCSRCKHKIRNENNQKRNCKKNRKKSNRCFVLSSYRLVYVSQELPSCPNKIKMFIRVN